MRYLRPVRIDENKDEVPNDNDEENLRQRGFLDPTSRAAIRRAIKTHEKLGNHKRVAELEGQLEKAEEALKTPLAPAATAPQRYPRLAGFGPAGLRTARLQPRKESFIPLTLPNLMEINIVKGPDGKPRLASGNGTTLRTNRGPRVKSAMDILNRGEELTPAGAKSLKNAEISMGNTRALQPSKFLGKRHRTSVRKRGRPSSGGHGGDYEGVDMARDSAENRLT